MIQTLHLFRPLHTKLIEVLSSLQPDDWSRPTVARQWTIKDITAHLLDGSIRTISLYRDNWSGPPPVIDGYGSLVAYLNQLNADWVKAMVRVSPDLLIQWLSDTHEDFIRCFEALDPQGTARFSVAWAGEDSSANWFHIAREYTERWHHQQQIREAMGNQEILTPTLYHPVLETFLLALPHAYRDANAPEGSRVVVEVTGDAGGRWEIERQSSRWVFIPSGKSKADAHVRIPADLAWKLFTKAAAPELVRGRIDISGTETLAWPALRMLSVMA